jgi:curli biogenesis system outer membrane secretion channel CsgG
MLADQISAKAGGESFMKRGFAILAFVAVFGLIAWASGCASSSSTAAPDEMTRHVGVYPAPPPGLVKARLGVPDFKIIEGGSRKLEEFAAAQLATMAFQSKRFTVIERDQLDQLLKEQSLEGIVKQEEMAKAGQVRGVDYLLYGKVTNLRVKAEKTSRGLGIAQLPVVGIGGFDYKKKDTTVVAECGVDLKMTDPTSGEQVAGHFGEYNRTDTVGAFGIEILGAGADADADLQITEDDKGKILRLALDECFRKMLDDIDAVLLARPVKAPPAAPPPQAPPQAAQSAPPAETPAAAQSAPAAKEPAAGGFCTKCGTQLAADAKFCAKCGTAVSP